ncbi:MAG TPA: zinc ribbon domain-containing protein [Ktedonosporobacter sp.]|nr:zinc ribbon domain-containing protein [Ktedonosporobacter sp.]
MNCNTCGSLIPHSAQFCPDCGTASPVYHANSYEQTARASQQPGYRDPHIAYGSDPYQQVAQQYTLTPVSTPPPITAPPPPKPRGKIALIVLMLLLAVAVVGGGSYLLAGVFIKGNPVQGNPNATATALAKHATATALAKQANASATATATANQNPYGPKTGSLVLNDSLHDNSKSYKWDEATMNNGGNVFRCGFVNAAYHISSDQSGIIICDPEAPELTLSDITFEVKVTINKGNEAGVVVRFNQTKGPGYLFAIDINGNYTISIINVTTADTSQRYTVLRHGSNGQIKQGLNQTNLVAIVANKASISAYVNGTFIDVTQDSSLTNGQIGIYGSSSNGAVDIAANDARAWRL